MASRVQLSWDGPDGVKSVVRVLTDQLLAACPAPRSIVCVDTDDYTPLDFRRSRMLPLGVMLAFSLRDRAPDDPLPRVFAAEMEGSRILLEDGFYGLPPGAFCVLASVRSWGGDEWRDPLNIAAILGQQVFQGHVASAVQRAMVQTAVVCDYQEAGKPPPKISVHASAATRTGASPDMQYGIAFPWETP